MGYKRIKNNVGTKILMAAVSVNNRTRTHASLNMIITMANLNWYMAKRNVTSYIEMILKIAILKKGIGIKSEKLCKQVRDQIVWKQLVDTAQGLL